MPFKIVETIERGKLKLSIVPKGWENNGILRWPGKKYNSYKVFNENSKPYTDWARAECIVKRESITTYEKAEDELHVMLDRSDSETTDHSDEDTVTSELYQVGVQDSSEDMPSASSVYQINTNEGTMQTNNIDKVLKNQKAILDNQKSIMSNQKIIKKSQKLILETLEKHSQQMANMTALIEDSFKQLLGNPNLSAVKLAEVNPIGSEAYVIKPVSNDKELIQLENALSDKYTRKKLLLQFTFMCNKSEGSGVNCAYKMLDILFARDFLCKCSWSGGSKGQDVKVPLKAYKNVLYFFFTLINSWDTSYTHDDNEKFFKTVLRNSVKRLSMKNARTSTKRNRKVLDKSNKRTKYALPRTEEMEETMVEVNETVKDLIEEAISDIITVDNNNEELESDS